MDLIKYLRDIEVFNMIGINNQLKNNAKLHQFIEITVLCYIMQTVLKICFGWLQFLYVNMNKSQLNMESRCWHVY